MTHKNTLIVSMIAMGLVVFISNILVQFPINNWLTWGAFSYPFAFLVTDITTRIHGPKTARYIVLLGFALGVVLSMTANPRIAIASGTAFFTAQMIDITLFQRLLKKTKQWWKAPLFSSSFASVLDTSLFFSIAFIGTSLPWVTWAIGDLFVKWSVALIVLIPYKFSLLYLLQEKKITPKRTPS